MDGNGARKVPSWGEVEGGGLSFAKPHGEVRNHRLLLLQPRREVTTSRDERVCFVNQVAREGPGEEPLVRRFPSGLLHRWGDRIAVLWGN